MSTTNAQITAVCHAILAFKEKLKVAEQKNYDNASEITNLQQIIANLHDAIATLKGN